MSSATDAASWATGRVPTLPPIPPNGYVDANSYIGEWPARRLNGSPPPPRDALAGQRLALMDQLGIRRAAVSLLDGVFLKDSGTANQELHQLVDGHSDRLLPVYTLNPAFPAWEEHLEACTGSFGLRPGTGAIRLYPAYHGYSMDAPEIAPCLERLAALDLPAVLPVQLEDARMQHPAMQVPDLPPAGVARLIGRLLGIRWMVVAATSAQITAIAAQLPAEARVWFDLSRVQGPFDALRLLRERVGIRRVLFGTNLPLHIAESPILEVADARLSPEEDTAVRFGNARTALGIGD